MILACIATLGLEPTRFVERLASRLLHLRLELHTPRFMQASRPFEWPRGSLEPADSLSAEVGEEAETSPSSC